MHEQPILRIAVAAPVPRLFDYLPPNNESGANLLPGMRVLVPFGKRNRVGVIISVTAEPDVDRGRLKTIDKALDPAPVLSDRDLSLILWAADYYHHSPGAALFSALPSRLRHAQPLLEKGTRGWRLTSSGRALDAASLTRAPRQADILSHLNTCPKGWTAAALKAVLGDCTGTLRALAAKGLAEPVLIDDAAAPQRQPARGPELNPEQQAAVAAIRARLGQFHPIVLDGITGSGKTEVYIHCLDTALRRGLQALVLVPEIGLTPQLLDRLTQRLPVAPRVLHSALGDREREQAWRSAASGHSSLIVGTRSAVFTPMPRLGLVLVDEEHDLSYKQQDGFRYSARDLAVRRAQQCGCPVVLGSATPSLETLKNVRDGRYDRLALRMRAGNAKPPRVDLLDIRAQPLHAGLSPVLLDMVRKELTSGNQVLLFLNRRGFAPVLTCHTCGWVAECTHCDARLTLHLNSRRLWCHHCGLSRPIPSTCPECTADALRPLGIGTERLEEELRGLFPSTPMARIDRDSTRRKGELERLLVAARRGELPLMIGTQMLAKGHDFPGVTLVGILNLDQGLFGSDFRSPERLAQLIIQVAGRAGRADKAGRMVLQTRHPEHPLLRTLLKNGYAAFADEALRERAEARLPPFAHLALMRAEARDAEHGVGFLRFAAEAAAPLLGDSVTLWGPVPAPMERRAGRYRAHLLVQSVGRTALQRFLGAWLPLVRRAPGASRIRHSIDVDPQEML